MKFIIPIAGVPNENFRLTLDNKEYRFSFYYNFTFRFWVMSLGFGSETIFQNVKVVQGINIGDIYNPSRTLFKGVFYISSLSGSQADPTFDNFGKDMRLIYEV